MVRRYYPSNDVKFSGATYVVAGTDYTDWYPGVLILPTISPTLALIGIDFYSHLQRH